MFAAIFSIVFFQCAGRLASDFVLYVLLLLPRHDGAFLVRVGDRLRFSWRYKEVSWNSPARIQIYFFKTLNPGGWGLC